MKTEKQKNIKSVSGNKLFQNSTTALCLECAVWNYLLGSRRVNSISCSACVNSFCALVSGEHQHGFPSAFCALALPWLSQGPLTTAYSEVSSEHGVLCQTP